MATKIERLTTEALSLSVQERARLVSRLVESLDQAVDEAVELAWIEEAERRYDELRENPALAEPTAAAFQRARDALR